MSMYPTNALARRESFSTSSVREVEMPSRRSSEGRQPVSLPGQKNSLERKCWERDERKTHEAQKMAKKKAERRKLFFFSFLCSVFFPVGIAIGTYKLICFLKEKYEARRELHALLCDSLPDGALEIPRGENVPTSDPYDFVTQGETPQSKELLGFGVEEEALLEEEDESDCESLFDSSEATPEDSSEVLLGFGVEEEGLAEEEDNLEDEELFGLSGPTPEEPTEGFQEDFETPAGGEDFVLDALPDLPALDSQGGEESDCEEEFGDEISDRQPGMAKIDPDFAKFLKNEITSEVLFQKRLLKENELSALAKKIDRKEFRKNPEDKRLLEIVGAFEVARKENEPRSLIRLIDKKYQESDLIKDNKSQNELKISNRLLNTILNSI